MAWRISNRFIGRDHYTSRHLLLAHESLHPLIGRSDSWKRGKTPQLQLEGGAEHEPAVLQHSRRLKLRLEGCSLPCTSTSSAKVPRGQDSWRLASSARFGRRPGLKASHVLAESKNEWNGLSTLRNAVLCNCRSARHPQSFIGYVPGTTTTRAGMYLVTAAQFFFLGEIGLKHDCMFPA